MDRDVFFCAIIIYIGKKQQLTDDEISSKINTKSAENKKRTTIPRKCLMTVTEKTNPR